jgi:hypothetical protein
MPPLFGDELDGAVKWKTASSLPTSHGQTVRLRFVFKDADLFALRFAE